MLELLIYSIGVMYSPGPVNLLSLNMGLNGRFYQSLPFCIGVGSAMFLLFVLFGLTGGKVITQTHMTFIGIAGSLYISYLAWRIYFANPIIDPTNQLSLDNRSKFVLFKDGFLMQTLNPKGIVATLPVGAIYFPTLKLTDGEIIFGSAILALLAMCAPGSYSLLGKFANSAIRNPKYFLVFNKILAALLVWTAISICLDLV